MYCSHCGNEVAKGEAFCAACGMAVRAGEGREVTASPAREAAGYNSWEYTRTVVPNELAQVATDCYESLGYELTSARSEARVGGSHVKSTLAFRRSRKVRGKAQLAKLQRTMDDLLASICRMEGEKTRKASLRALSVGIVSALVLGIGMCCTMVWQSLMVPGIIIGLVGIAGCVAAYFLYRRICAQETDRLNPSIEAAYDSLSTTCEEAQAVLRAQS